MPKKLKVFLPICLYFRAQAHATAIAINLGQLVNSTPTYSIQTYIKHTYMHTWIDCQNIELNMEWKSKWTLFCSHSIGYPVGFFPVFLIAAGSRVQYTALRCLPWEKNLCIFFSYVVFVVRLPCLSSLPSDSSEQKAALCPFSSTNPHCWSTSS